MQAAANPHDHFFKQVLSDPQVARDFVQNYLPEPVVAQLDLDTLTISAESFVDEALQAHHTDLLFTVQQQSGDDSLIYLLFEHKSYADRLVSFQLLRYMVRIWQHSLRQYERLVPVLPVVLYHGAASWRLEPGFRWLVQGPTVFHSYTPDFEYHLCDLSHFSDDEIRGEIILRVTLMVLKHAMNDNFGPHLIRALTLLHELAEQDTGLQYLETLLRYVTVSGADLSSDELQTAVSKVFPEGDRIMATIAQAWIEQGIEKGHKLGLQQGVKQGVQQGVKQGVKQGVQQGRREGYLAAIELGLELRFGAEGLSLLPEVHKISDLETLRAVQRALKTAVSPDQIRFIYQQSA